MRIHRTAWVVYVAASVTALAGCNAIVGIDGFSVNDGSPPDDGPPDTPLCIERCDGDGTLVACNGGTEEPRTCAVGCSATPAPHCKEMVPSNGATKDDLAGVATVAPLVFDAGRKYELYTDTGRILDVTVGRDVGNAVEIRPAQDGLAGKAFYRKVDGTIGVLAVSALTIGPGARVNGFGDRALIILAQGEALIQGEIDFSGGCYVGDTFTTVCGGPGGGKGATPRVAVATGCGPGKDGDGSPGGAGDEAGGGGGGFGTAGAAGGNGTDDVNKGGMGGPACDRPTLVPLIGGSGGGAGGAGGAGDADGGRGGGGGGAIQITSLTSIAFRASELSTNPPTIYVGGAGGSAPTAAEQGGGGGGAGGGILLEAPVITIDAKAVLSANGAGGGNGVIARDNVGTTRENGDYGSRNADRARGGSSGGIGGNGGDGSARGSLPVSGSGDVDGGGGGGGAVGFIRININAAPQIDPQAMITPQHTSGSLVTQ